MYIEGRVGPQTLGDGVYTQPRLSRDGAVVALDAHARYQEATFRGNMYSGGNQAAQAISVALATTYTGLALYNPLNSQVKLVVNKVKFALSVAPAAIATIGLIYAQQISADPTGQTAITPKNNLLGSANQPTGKLLSAATIVTPVWQAQLVDGFTAAALPSPSNEVDLEGCYILLPGAFLAFGALTAVTGLGWISWEEIPA